MIIINQGVASKSYNIPGLGIVPITEFQKFKEDSILGKGMLNYHPQVCFTDENSNTELLVEEPVCIAEVEKKEPEAEEDSIDQENLCDDEEPEDSTFILKPLEEFDGNKDTLKVYGDECGINLKKNKSIENMYLDLVEFVQGK